MINVKMKIKDQLMKTINEFEGKSFDERMVNFYEYYENIYNKDHSLSSEKGVGYNFAKDGNRACLIYYDDIREFYGFEKEKGSLDFKTYEGYCQYRDEIAPKENEKLYYQYLKDVDVVCKSMYDVSRENIASEKALLHFEKKFDDKSFEIGNKKESEGLNNKGKEVVKEYKGR